MSLDLFRPSVRPFCLVLICVTFLIMSLPVARSAEYYNNKSLSRRLASLTEENPNLVRHQDVANHISPPDIVSMEGDEIRVLSSGRVTDRFFKRVQAVERRPERVELDTIGGMSAVRVQFIIEGKGKFTITVDSTKAGLLNINQLLPSTN